MEQEQGSVVTAAPEKVVVAEPAQPKNNKNKIGMIVGIVCLVVLAVAGLSFGVYAMITKDAAVAEANGECGEDDEKEEITVTQENGTTTVVVVKDNTEQGEVKNLIKKVYDNLVKNINAAYDWTFGDGTMIKIAGTDVYTNTNESYGIASWGSYYSEDLEKRVMTESYGYVREVLINNGYSKAAETMGGELYYNSGTKIYCDISDGSLPYRMSCSKENWISDDVKKLVLELAEVAKDEFEPIYISTTDGYKINNSEVSPYQNIIVGGPGAALLFYRSAPDAKWQFFKGTQEFIPCNDYTGDVAKAFAGEQCWDTETNQESTVQP